MKLIFILRLILLIYFLINNNEWVRLELTDSYILYDGDLTNYYSPGQTYWLNEVNFNYIINNFDKIELLE